MKITFKNSEHFVRYGDILGGVFLGSRIPHWIVYSRMGAYTLSSQRARHTTTAV